MLPPLIRNYFFRVFLLCALFPTRASGQLNPLIWQIDAASYQLEGKGISPQMRQFLQTDEGMMLMVNTTGILSFDGRIWTMLPGTEGKRFRLTKSPDGTIFACHGQTIGFFRVNNLGKYQFEVLVDSLPGEENADIFQITCTRNQAHFLSEKFVYSWDLRLGRLMVREMPGEILNACPVHDENDLALILQEGLYLLGDESAQWLIHTALPDFSEVRAAIATGKGRPSDLLLFTKEQGIWRWGPDRPEPAFPELTQTYPDLLIWNATTMHDGTIAIGTYYDGVLFLDPESGDISQVDARSGIDGGPVYQLFEDREHGLWIAGETSVSRFPYPLPLVYFQENNGLGGVTTSIRQYRGQLYAGTTRGLYRLNQQQPGNIQFQPVSPGEIREVWDLYAGREGIWVAASSGLFLIGKDGKTVQLTDLLCMAVKESRFDSNLVVAGLYEGLGTCRKGNRGWQWQGTIPGYFSRSESLAETAPGEWWACYKDLVRVKGIELSDPDITFLKESDGWSPDMRIMDLALENGYLAVGSDLGRFIIDQDSLTLAPDTAWNHALPINYQQSHWSTSSRKNGYWIYNGGFVGKMEAAESGGFQWKNLLLSGLRTDVWTLFEDPGGLLWVGTNDGILRFDPAVSQMPDLPFATYFRDIQLEGDSLVPVFHLADDMPQFRHGQSDLLFGYSAVAFTFPDLLEFQYKLDGYDEAWSPWARQADREKYTQLREGRYTFRVRARNLFGQISEEARYSFLILPPWYRTWWAFLIYLALVGWLVYAIVRYQTRVQKKRLEAKERELSLERQTTERLRAIDRLKDQFLANTSHELRTPLNGIIGLAESMYHGETKEQDKYNLGLIVSSGKRLHSLVNDILDFSKLRSHEIDLQKKTIDLKAIAEVVMHIQQPLVNHKPVRLENQIPEGFPPVFADEDRITQVFHNLIGNAVKFTHSGEITISAREFAEYVSVSVTDTGIGIPADKQEEVFLAFEQGDGSIQRHYAGTGLGLPISRQLIELHGGKLTLQSREGEGSTFTFTLPRTGGEDAQPQTTVATMPASAPVIHPERAVVSESIQASKTGGVSILVVDDEAINLEVMKAHLSDPEISLAFASNGPEALELVNTQAGFDLVILDVMMPGMSGFEVCRIIRQRYTPSELPVIIVTAKDQVEDLVQAFSFGANDYIAKPFSRAEFLSRVKTQLYLQTIHQATRRFVPTEFLSALGYEAITETRYGDQVERSGTILFSDIRNYTTIAESLSPEETFLFLNAYYSRMGPVIRQHSGFINQFIGDGIMALFLASTDDAVRAGIGMQRALAAYNKDRKERGFLPIGAGMGLHSGKLMMGIIGDGVRMDAALVSDTVNTASRVEGLTKLVGSEMLLSSTTVDSLKHPEQFSLRFLCKVTAKGKEQPFGLYECLDSLPENLRDERMNTDADLRRAFSMVEARDFEPAIQLYETLAKQFPTDHAIRFVLAETRKASKYGHTADWNGALVISVK